MRTRKSISGPILAITFLPALAALADFNGVFSGAYAPANWTTTITGSSGFQNSAFINASGAPNAVVIYGAVGPGPDSLISVIDYAISLPGTGAETVSFNFSFFNPAGSPNQAAVLRNGNTVSVLAGDSQFNSSGLFFGGDVLDLRVYSNNGDIPDSLTVSPVPEPTTLAFAAIGGAGWFCRRKFFQC